jgi:hypothetical protein
MKADIAVFLTCVKLGKGSGYGSGSSSKGKVGSGSGLASQRYQSTTLRDSYPGANMYGNFSKGLVPVPDEKHITYKNEFVREPYHKAFRIQVPVHVTVFYFEYLRLSSDYDTSL